MGQTRPLFVYFPSFQMTNKPQILINDKSLDGVLRTRTRGTKMVGTDKSTELWLHQFNYYFRFPKRPTPISTFYFGKADLLTQVQNTLSLDKVDWKQCDQMLQFKVAQFFQQMPKKNPLKVSIENCHISKEPQKLPNVWATF